MNALVIVPIVWAVLTTVLWLVIGWRAMKAHEKIAVNMDFIERRLQDIAKHLTEKQGH